MKSQAIAALGTVVVWLLINNAALLAIVNDVDLGSRSEEILLKQLEPLISQLALAALAVSAVIWLLGGAIRKLLALAAAALLTLGSFNLFKLVQNSEAMVTSELSLSGDLINVEIGLSIYLAFAVSVVSALLYLWALKTPVIDKSKRPNLRAKPNVWRDQDEGRDGTAL